MGGRTLPAAVDTAVGLDLTGPTYLVEFLFGSPLYYTTRQEVTWDSKTWIALGLRVDRINADSAVVVFPNHDNTGSALALNNALRDTEIRIYEHHDTDAVEVFRGFGDDVDIDGTETRITLRSSSRGRAVAPRLRVARPTFTRLPIAGATFTLGDYVIRVES